MLRCSFGYSFVAVFAAAVLCAQAPPRAGDLLGAWLSESGMGSIRLVFKSETELELMGESASYILVPGALRIRDEDGTVDYPFTIRGNVLTISFPEGYQLQFTRVGQAKRAPAPAEPARTEAPSRAPAPSRQTAATPPAPGLSVDEIGDPNWGFKFRAPAGWKAQKSEGGAVLGHDTIAGMILVIPHMAASGQQVQQQMMEGIAEEGVQLSLTGRLSSLGAGAMAGDYSGIYNGQQVRARGIGTSSPSGGGAYIIALTTPGSYSGQLAGAAEAVAGGMQYFQSHGSDLMRYFAGTWATMTTNTETTVQLSPTGEFFYNYEASYSGGFREGGQNAGAWGTANQSRNRGRWSVRGTKERGTIVLTYQDGSTAAVEYRVHVEGGQTYRNEYYFDGKLYGRK